MKASDELNEEQIRQMLFDLESSYTAYVAMWCISLLQVPQITLQLTMYISTCIVDLSVHVVLLLLRWISIPVRVFVWIIGWEIWQCAYPGSVSSLRCSAGGRLPWRIHSLLWSWLLQVWIWWESRAPNPSRHSRVAPWPVAVHGIHPPSGRQGWGAMRGSVVKGLAC